MTAPFRRVAVCHRCGVTIPLEDEVSSWIRRHPDLRSGDGFTFMDKDLICHRFKTTHGRSFQCVMFVEFKSRGRQLDDTQRDTMHIVNQMFRSDCTTPTKRAKKHLKQVPSLVFAAKSETWIKAKAFGYHLVRMDGSTPDDSSQILWDKTEVTVRELLGLLRFDLHPDTLKPMDWRLHHSQRSEKELFSLP